jgi:hypothetical protein
MKRLRGWGNKETEETETEEKSGNEKTERRGRTKELN